MLMQGVERGIPWESAIRMSHNRFVMFVLAHDHGKESQEKQRNKSKVRRATQADIDAFLH